MTGYTYTYLSPEEVFALIPKLTEMWLLDFMLAWIGFAIVVIWIFIVIPGIVITFKNYKTNKSKAWKKKILTQILLQKEIEDEVEKEIKMDSEQRVV